MPKWVAEQKAAAKTDAERQAVQQTYEASRANGTIKSLTNLHSVTSASNQQKPVQQGMNSTGYTLSGTGYGDKDVVAYADYFNGAMTGGTSDYNTTKSYLAEAIKYRDDAIANNDAVRGDYWARLAYGLNVLANTNNRTERDKLQAQLEAQKRQTNNVKGAAMSAASNVQFWNPDDFNSEEYKKADIKSRHLQDDYNRAQNREKELQSQIDALNSDMFDRNATEAVKEAKKRLEENVYATNIDEIESGKMQKADDQALVDAFMQSIGESPAFYNLEDKWLASIDSSLLGIGSSLADTAAALWRAGEQTDPGRIMWEGLPSQKATPEERAEIAKKKAAYDAERGEGAYARDFGHAIQINECNQNIAWYEQQMESLKKSVGPNGYMENALQYKEYEDKLKAVKKLRRELVQADIDAGITSSESLQKLESFAADTRLQSDKLISQALNGANTAEKYLLLGTRTALEMGFDMAVGSAAGGSSLIPMFARVFGSSAGEAYRDGADLVQQFGYGLAEGGIELLTEKMFGAFDKIGYGKGYAQKLSDKIISNLASSPAGMSTIRFFLEAFEEGGEEVMSDVLGAFADVIYKDGGLAKNFKEETADIWTDFFLGALMGGVGGIAGIAAGQDAQANAEIYAGQIQADAQKLTQQKADAEAEAKAKKAPNGSIASRLIQNTGDTATQRNQRINQLLLNPQELAFFERETGQKVTGETNAEKRESVIKILADYRNAQSEPVTLSDPSKATQVFSKVIQAKGMGSAIPPEMRLSKDEFNIAKAMGLVTENDRANIATNVQGGFGTPGDNMPGLKTQPVDHTKGKEGVVARNVGSTASEYVKNIVNKVADFKQRQAEAAAPEGKTEAPKGKTAPAVDSSATIEEKKPESETPPESTAPKYGEEGWVNPMGEDVGDFKSTPDETLVEELKNQEAEQKAIKEEAEARAKQAAAEAGKTEAKGEEAATATETAQGEEQASTQQSTPEEDKKAVKPGRKSPRQKADNDAITNARTTSTRTTFTVPFGDQVYKITYDATRDAEGKQNSKVIIVDADGNPVTAYDINGKPVTGDWYSPSMFKKFMNAARNGKNIRFESVEAQTAEPVNAEPVAKTEPTPAAPAPEPVQPAEAQQASVKPTEQPQEAPVTEPAVQENEAKEEQPAEKSTPEPAEIEGAVKTEGAVAVPITEAPKPKGKKAPKTPGVAEDGTTTESLLERITNKEEGWDNWENIKAYVGDARKGKIISAADFFKMLGVKNADVNHPDRAYKKYIKSQTAEPEVRYTDEQIYDLAEGDAIKNVTRLLNNPSMADLIDEKSTAARQVAESIVGGYAKAGYAVDLRADDIAAIAVDILREKGVKFNEDASIKEQIAEVKQFLTTDATKAAEEAVKKRNEGYKRAADAAEAKDRAENLKELENKDQILGLVLSTEEIKNVTNNTEGGTQDVSTQRPERNLGRIPSGEPEEIRAWFGQRGDSVRANGRTDAEAWLSNTGEYTKDGARVLSEQEVSDEDYAAAEALTRDGAVPAVTFIDVSGMKNPPNMAGFVDAANPDSGIYLFVNNPKMVGNKITRGLAVLHEPTHYWIAKYRQSHDGNNPDFDVLVQSIVGKALNTTERGRILHFASKLMCLEARHSGRSIFNKLGGIDDAQWAKFKNADDEGKFALTDEWLGEDDSIAFWSEVQEELLANLGAGNEILNDGSFNLKAVQYYAREVMSAEDIIPEGYLAGLEQSAFALDAKQPLPNSTTVSQSGSNAYGTNIRGLELDQEPVDFSDGLEVKPWTTNPGVKAKKRIQGLTEERDDLAAQNEELAKQVEELKAQLEESQYKAEEPRTPTADDILAERMEDTPINRYLDSRYYPETGVTGYRQNKEELKRRTMGERSGAGPTQYKSLSEAAVRDAAANNVRNNPLGAYEYLMSDRCAGDRLDLSEAVQLTSMLDNEITDRATGAVNPMHEQFKDIDTNKLIDMANDLNHKYVNIKGTAGGVLTQDSQMTPDEQVLTNLRQTFIGPIRQADIDPENVNTKMFAVGRDHVLYLNDIQSRLDSNSITKEEATDLVLKELKEINQIRDVNRIFGAAGRAMTSLESKMLDRIAKHSGDSAYDTLRMMALGSINRMCSDFSVVGTINTVKQIRYLNLLSNVATTVNNVLNNLESSTTQAIQHNVGRRLTNKRVKELLDGEEALAKDYSWQHLFGKSKELNEYMLTKGAESFLSLYYGLDVDEGIIDVDMGTAKHNQEDNAFGQMLARFQFLSGLAMTTTDAMAIARAYKGLELGINEANLTPEQKADAMKGIHMEARERMYHGETEMAKVMAKFRDALNRITLVGNSKVGKIGFGDVLMPFVQVPTNIAMRAVRATPAGALYGMINYFRGMHALEARKQRIADAEALWAQHEHGRPLTIDEQHEIEEARKLSAPTAREVRKLQRQLGEAATNGALTAIAFALSWMGAIKNFDDEDDEDMKRLAKEKGFSGLQINLSALLHGGKWNDDDDLVFGGSWLEIMAIPMAIGYHMFKEWNQNGRGADDLARSVYMSPLSTLQTMIDAMQEVPGIKQVAEIWEAYENLQKYTNLSDGLTKTGASLTQYAANTLGSFFIPNIYSQFGAGLDNTVRDVYNADTNLEIARNIIMNKTVALRRMLPEAKDTFNNTRRYGANRAMGVLNRMILPGSGVQVWQRGELEQYYAKLSAEGRDNVMAKKSAPNKIKVNNTEWKLNAEEKRTFDELYSGETAELHELMIHDKTFTSLSSELQELAMQEARTLAYHTVENFTLSNIEGCEERIDLKNWEEAYKDDPKKAVQYLVTKYAAKPLYDTKTDLLTGTKGMDAFIKVYEKADEEMQKLLDTSYPNFDKYYKGYKEVGLTPEEFNRGMELKRKYDEIAKTTDESATQASRDLAAAYEKEFSGDKLQWQLDNNKLYQTNAANTQRRDKFAGQGFSMGKIDGFEDYRESTPIEGGYTTMSQNQKIQLIANYKGFSKEEAWRWLKTELGEDSSAYKKINAYRQRYPQATVKEAIEAPSTTYSQKNADTNWKWETRRYDKIYPKKAA